MFDFDEVTQFDYFGTVAHVEIQTDSSLRSMSLVFY